MEDSRIRETEIPEDLEALTDRLCEELRGPYYLDTLFLCSLA